MSNWWWKPKRREQKRQEKNSKKKKNDFEYKMKRGNVASMTSFLPFSFLILFATKTTRALPPSLQRPAATEARGLPSYTRTSLEDWGGRTQSRQSTKRKKKAGFHKKSAFLKKRGNSTSDQVVECRCASALQLMVFPCFKDNVHCLGKTVKQHRNNLHCHTCT